MKGRVCVFDLESDGLLDEVTVIHCGVFRDVNTGEVSKFGPSDMEDMAKYIRGCGALIGHNIILYDVPLLHRILGLSLCNGVELYDTWIISQMLNPDKRRNSKCTGTVGAHSLESISYDLGREKVKHGDWSVFSEKMMHRCTTDVEDTYLFWLQVNEEAKLI